MVSVKQPITESATWDLQWPARHDDTGIDVPAALTDVSEPTADADATVATIILPAFNEAAALPEELPAQPRFRVLMVTARYFPYAGGTETHTYEVARRLAAAGHEVRVLTTDPGGTLSASERSEGIDIVRVRAWPKRHDYYFAPGIYHEILDGTWDVLHCQGYHNLVPPVAMLAALRSRTPYVLSFHSGGHSSGFRNAVRGVQWEMLRPLLSRAKRLVAVSRFEADFFCRRLRLPPERFVVIPNGAKLPTLATPVTASVEESLIVSVGRLERYKGHHRAIAAMPRVIQHRPNARLRIVGEGPFEHDLRQLAARLGVAERVEIKGIGAGDRAGMARLLPRAALVTLLSDYEAHPIAAMEAIGAGRPLLVTYTSGLAELADRGLVRAIRPESTTDEIADAVLDILHRPFTPPRVQLPTWDDCAARLLALYADVVRVSPCAS